MLDCYGPDFGCVDKKQMEMTTQTARRRAREGEVGGGALCRDVKKDADDKKQQTKDGTIVCTQIAILDTDSSRVDDNTMHDMMHDTIHDARSKMRVVLYDISPTPLLLVSWAHLLPY